MFNTFAHNLDLDQVISYMAIVIHFWLHVHVEKAGFWKFSMCHRGSIIGFKTTCRERFVLIKA